MKSNPLGSKLLAGLVLALGTSLAIPTAFADRGSGASIWRTQPKTDEAVVAPATGAEAAPLNCTDSRVVPVTETKWARTGGGRAPAPKVIGQERICNSCSQSEKAAKTTDRNAHGKQWLAIRSTHACPAAGCGTIARIG